ncbi:hypothetical protein BDZ89DRAFT_1142106 [Hymenopellis radicata]|nr:hypothetical protein BDZ89DRAFT_1142106 [Hymenopellis radicata]
MSSATELHKNQDLLNSPKDGGNQQSDFACGEADSEAAEDAASAITALREALKTPFGIHSHLPWFTPLSAIYAYHPSDPSPVDVEGLEGIHPYINLGLESLSNDELMEVMDDLDEESETAEMCENSDDDDDGSDDDDDDEEFDFVRSQVAQDVNPNMAKSYTRLSLQFAKYGQEKGWWKTGVKPWDLKVLPKRIDLMIAAWIMDACDDHFSNGQPRTEGKPLAMTTANKMRSALTKRFSFEGRRGRLAWDPEKGTGNPTISIGLSSFLKGLQRRKVQVHGEKPTSSRALTATNMQDIYRGTMFHLQNPSEKDWASAGIRIALQAILTIAFICFLRLDEVLTLQAHEIEFGYDKVLELSFIIIRLHHRKNRPFGDINHSSSMNFLIIWHIYALCAGRADGSAIRELARATCFAHLTKEEI